MRNNWKNMESNAKLIKRRVKSIQAISDYLANLPGDKSMRDNISKNVPPEVVASGEFIKSLDSDTLAKYDEMWTKLKQ